MAQVSDKFASFIEHHVEYSIPTHNFSGGVLEFAVNYLAMSKELCED